MALNALQYEEIIKDYEKLRDKNRHLLESRREEVYAKLPGYRELEDSISTLSVSAARQLLDGDSSARTRLHDSLIRIRSKQKELLDSACFPRDTWSLFTPVPAVRIPAMCPEKMVCRKNAGVSAKRKFPFFILSPIYRK